MVDWGALPPEINSGRIYAGPGPGPLLAAAAAWQSLTVELGMVGGDIEATLSALAAGPWLGPSAMAMLAAAQPFVAWVMTQAAQTQVAAAATGQLAAAYSTAFAAHIPPPAIAANRTLLASLVATNFFGVNSAAIAATEADYTEMWAQDAAAMYAYSAAAGAAAASLTADPFIPPADATNAAGLAGQAASTADAAGQSAGTAGSTAGQAGDAVSGMGSSLGGLASAPSEAASSLTSPLQSLTSLPSSMASGMGGMGTNPANTGMSPVAGLLGGGMFGSLLTPAASGAGSSIGAIPSGVGGMSGSPVTAMMGRASPIGRLSAPPGWAENSQRLTLTEQTAVSAAPAAEAEGGPVAGGVRGMPMMAGAGGGSSSPAAVVGSKRTPKMSGEDMKF
jgi:PPE-repeat protein